MGSQRYSVTLLSYVVRSCSPIPISIAAPTPELPQIWSCDLLSSVAWPRSMPTSARPRRFSATISPSGVCSVRNHRHAPPSPTPAAPAPPSPASGSWAAPCRGVGPWGGRISPRCPPCHHGRHSHSSPRRGDTHVVQVTPYKRSAVWCHSAAQCGAAA